MKIKSIKDRLISIKQERVDAVALGIDMLNKYLHYAPSAYDEDCKKAIKLLQIILKENLI